MKTIERHIDVAVPAAEAYSQWTQFEDFPRFMQGVQNVLQIDERLVKWEVRFAGVHRSFVTEITEQIPDMRIAWNSTAGLAHAGCVTFHRLSDDNCRVMVQMEFAPEGFLESAAETLGLVHGRVANELGNFKRFLEARDKPTGRWSGTIRSLDEEIKANPVT